MASLTPSKMSTDTLFTHNWPNKLNLLRLAGCCGGHQLLDDTHRCQQVDAYLLWQAAPVLVGRQLQGSDKFCHVAYIPGQAETILGQLHDFAGWQRPGEPCTDTHDTRDTLCNEEGSDMSILFWHLHSRSAKHLT